MATPPTGNPVGRPSTYTPELADLICEQIVEGKSLSMICRPNGMPKLSTIFGWFRKHPDFAENYARAVDQRVETFAEQIVEIADDGTNDWVEVLDKDGAVSHYQVNGEAVQRSRLRVDARKWIAAQMKPKKYGAAAQANATGQTGDTEFRVKNALSPGVK